jgi:glycosyltransferase involved in cell wall biosynthesis
MNFGLPAVVSERVGAAPDLVRPETGRTFPPGDVAALADCLRLLVADAGLRARLGQGALARIRQWSHAGSADTIVRAVEFALRGVPA